MIYAVTCGQHKPPKHLLLPYAVKTLTGNIEIIRIMNKFGHGVSYSQLEENDYCSVSSETRSQSQSESCTSSLHVFTNLAWDNIDRLEETLTGKGTSHRVNGIAVQPKVYGPFLPTAELPRIEKKKQRSISIEHEELEVYVAGERIGPQPLHTSESHVQESEAACQKNLVWILARQTDQENQVVPSWTGFNIRTSKGPSQKMLLGICPPSMLQPQS